VILPRPATVRDVRSKILAGMVLLPLLGGCGLLQPGPDLNVVIAERDVIGDWHNEAVGGTVHFAADRTFQAHDVPIETFFDWRSTPPPGFLAGRDHLDDHGSWRVAAPIADPERTTEIRADFARIPGVTVGLGTEIGAERQPDGSTGLVLLVYDSPRFPDGRYVLTRA
jgi:hypothetical protein